jgi:hypothetical protein
LLSRSTCTRYGKAAVEEDNCALVELLIQKGAAVDHVNRNGTTRWGLYKALWVKGLGQGAESS